MPNLPDEFDDLGESRGTHWMAARFQTTRRIHRELAFQAGTPLFSRPGAFTRLEKP
jgi:hypothetical protein